MRALYFTLLTAALTALVGCAPETDVEPLPCRNPEAGTARIGLGDLQTGFLEMQNEHPVNVIFGPQGMHMLVVSVAIEDLEPSSIGGAGNEVTVGIRHDEYGIVAGAVEDMIPKMDDNISEFLGIRAIIQVAEVEILFDQIATVNTSVVDGCGREIRSAKKVLLLK